jgi:hypothetical protein
MTSIIQRVGEEANSLCEAYFCFLAFFCWLACRERSVPVKVVRFVLIMALGYMAKSKRVFVRRFNLKKKEEGVGALFEQKAV